MVRCVRQEQGPGILPQVASPRRDAEADSPARLRLFIGLGKRCCELCGAAGPRRAFDGVHLLRCARGLRLSSSSRREKKGAIQRAVGSLRNFTDTVCYDDFAMRGDGEHSVQALLTGLLTRVTTRRLRCRKFRLVDTSLLGRWSATIRLWLLRPEYLWKWCV